MYKSVIHLSILFLYIIYTKINFTLSLGSLVRGKTVLETLEIMRSVRIDLLDRYAEALVI